MELSAKSVLLCGDTHSDYGWMKHGVLPTARDLGVDAVIVVGDFGYFNDEWDFLNTTRTAREAFGVDVWFLDGNHEDFEILERDVRLGREREAGEYKDRDPVNLGGSLFYLPRGARVTIGGLKVAILGGATSIDRYDRVEGYNWFRAEEITEEDLKKAKDIGVADVLLSHDAPSGWEIPGKFDVSRMRPSWRAQIPACEAHREVLARGLDLVQAKLVVHGHYHSNYHRFVDRPWGAMEVVGLNCNGRSGWGVVLEDVDGEPSLRDMQRAWRV